MTFTLLSSQGPIPVHWETRLVQQAVGSRGAPLLPTRADAELSALTADALESTILDMLHDLSRKMFAQPAVCNSDNNQYIITEFILK